MSSTTHKPLHRLFRYTTATLAVAAMVMIATAFLQEDQWNARLLPQHLRSKIEWRTVSAEEIAAGFSLQPHFHTIIQIPETVQRITRNVLFGFTGKQIRYWGYCLPTDPEEADARIRRGQFPGILFLSEAEQKVQQDRVATQRRSRLSVYQQLDETQLNGENQPRDKVRHQKEIFTGGEQCYFMSQDAVPIGTDDDADGANTMVERENGSSPGNPDSDGDGILDGLEIFSLGTHAMQRDSDGDGLIDGIEDADRDGRRDATETNASEWDTDRDGLCDGLCKVNNGKDLRGEDRNLNGQLDEGESDPRKVDTDGDDILDEQEFMQCLQTGGQNC